MEWVATLFGLACVWLCVRGSIWNWPVGLVQVALYAWVFWCARLYADFGLHLVYVFLQIYGWYHWLGGNGGAVDSGAVGSSPELPIARWSATLAAAWLGASTAATLVLGSALYWYTDAALPYWDSAVAVLSLLAQYLLARKILENWLIWIAVDVLAVGLYLVKGLYVTSGLYAVFLCLAVAGWLAWRTRYREQSGAAADAGWSSGNSSPRTPDTSSSSTSPVTIASN